MNTISHRNQKKLQMRREGISQTEVARRFNLSPSRIHLVEKQDAETRAMEGRRARMIKQLQDADDIGKLWPIEDLLDTLGLIVVTRKRLVEHFAEKRQDQISLRGFMDMCLDAPVEGLDFMMSPLLRVYGLGRKGFWSVVKGLTDLDMGTRCNQEWQTRLVKVLIKHVSAWPK
jgi:hypothetical protein